MYYVAIPWHINDLTYINDLAYILHGIIMLSITLNLLFTAGYSGELEYEHVTPYVY